MNEQTCSHSDFFPNATFCLHTVGHMNAPSIVPKSSKKMQTKQQVQVKSSSPTHDDVNVDAHSNTRASASTESATAAEENPSFNTRFRSQSAQFFIYLVSLLAAFSVNGILQSSVENLALWKRGLISAALVAGCLVFVTVVSVWAKPDL